MRGKKRPSEKDARERALSLSDQTAARSQEEKFVWEALEEARQSVKPAVKKQMEGEMINQDLLNFRLRGRIDDPSSSWS